MAVKTRRPRRPMRPHRVRRGDARPDTAMPWRARYVGYRDDTTPHSHAELRRRIAETRPHAPIWMLVGLGAH